MELIHAKNPNRPAVIRDRSSKLTPHKESELLEYATGIREFACSVVSGAGRSLYIPTSSYGTMGVKMKGAGGLKRKSRSRLEFYPPQPKTSYSGEIGHMALEPDLTFSRAVSRPKALNSLTTRGAEMEFRAQTRLKIQGIGFDGLCWGEFGGEEEAGEVDVNGHPTGFAISEYDLSYAPLSRALLYETNQYGLVSQRTHHDALDSNGMEHHLALVQKMGGVKRRMALDAELGRHSSTLANFLYNTQTDDLLVTDTDTLLDYREMEPRARGAQFLRDTVSDLMKRVEELKFSEPSERTGGIIEETIRNFLRGLFRDSIKFEAIDSEVKELNIPNFVKKMDAGCQHKGNLTGLTYLYTFRPELYRAIYRLIMKSELPDIFKLLEIDPDELHQRAKVFFESNPHL